MTVAEPVTETTEPAEPTFYRARDSWTAALGFLASEWESLHRTYQSSILRSKHAREPELRAVIERSAAGALALREEVGKRMKAVLGKHVLHSWMAEHRGFPKGVHTARLIAAIGDPLRFPGRVCAEGHHLPSDFAGAECPVMIHGSESGEENGTGKVTAPSKVCGAGIGPVRRGTGVRSVWHYCGLHVVDGRLARQKKGQQGTWNPSVRGAILMPDVGLAAQLIRAGTGKGNPPGVQPWRGIYDDAKARLARERGVVQSPESERLGGSPARAEDSGGGVDCDLESGGCTGPTIHDSGEAKVDGPFEIDGRGGLASPNGNGGGVGGVCAIDRTPGSAATTSAEGVERLGAIDEASGPLRPIQIEQRARTIAVKAMIGDLLMEWKRRLEEGANRA